MMSDQSSMNNDLLNYLLTRDNPGVRYLALRDIVALPGDDQEVIESREKAHQAGPISLWQCNAFSIT
jgi:hypothetical protein